MNYMVNYCTCAYQVEIQLFSQKFSQWHHGDSLLCCRPYCSFHITTAACEAPDPKKIKNSNYIFLKYAVEVGVARPQAGP